MKLFVWDFHGTLEKGTEGAVREITNNVLEQSGYKIRLSKKDNLRLYGSKWSNYFEYLIPGKSEDIYFDLQKRCIEYEMAFPNIIKNYIQPNDYSHDVLTRIAKKHKQILISNMSKIGLGRFLRSVNMQKFFPRGNAFATHSHTKFTRTTKNELITNYLKKRKFDNVIVIGDTEVDMGMAKAANAISYLYAHPWKKHPKVKSDYKITSLKEVLKQL